MLAVVQDVYILNQYRWSMDYINDDLNTKGKLMSPLQLNSTESNWESREWKQLNATESN